MFRTDDLHIIANASCCKQGSDNKNDRAGAALVFFWLLGLRGFLRFRRFFLPGTAFQVILADRAGGINFPGCAFLRTGADILCRDRTHGVLALFRQRHQVSLGNAVQEVDVVAVPLSVNNQIEHIPVLGGDGVKLFIPIFPGGRI